MRANFAPAAAVRGHTRPCVWRLSRSARAEAAESRAEELTRRLVEVYRADYLQRPDPDKMAILLSLLADGERGNATRRDELCRLALAAAAGN